MVHLCFSDETIAWTVMRANDLLSSAQVLDAILLLL